MPVKLIKSETTSSKPKAEKLMNLPPKKGRRGHAKVRIPAIPLDMPGRYGTGNVLAVTGWSASNLWNRIRDGRFPPPQKDGNRAWWPTSVVREALGL